MQHRLESFPPTRDEAWRRIDAIAPAEYARSRNAIDGAVSGLSPYLTHGLVTMREVLDRLAQRHPGLSWDDKIVFELAWREYWQHVWRHHGDAVLADLRPGLDPPGGYAPAVPADVREARCGVGAIDTAVRTLYATGYLHNHARMWVASYLVHVRKVHWRAGADWMLAHLLDGDVPSNHLSWQWVAGTFSSKPYLFNAGNVARYAPRDGAEAWRCEGTAVDRGYEELDAWARQGGDAGPEPGRRDGIAEPPLFAAPPPGAVPLPALQGAQAGPVAWRHPWSLGPREGGAPCVALIHTPAFSAMAWSERRWRFVGAGLAAVCDAAFIGDAATLAPGPHGRIVAAAWPGHDAAAARVADVAPAPQAWPYPGRPMRSFSAFLAALRPLHPQPLAPLTAKSGPC